MAADGRSSPMRTLVPAALAAIALLSLAGCSSSGQGNLAVQATDAPDDLGDFSSLTVHVDQISIQGDGAGNHSYAPSHPTFDLTQLHDGNVSTLFNGSVPAGNYTYLELHITSASGVLKDGGQSVDVKVPSSRIFLNTHFSVAPGKTTTFTFDVQVHQVGNGDYQLKPNASGSRADR